MNVKRTLLALLFLFVAALPAVAQTPAPENPNRRIFTGQAAAVPIPGTNRFSLYVDTSGNLKLRRSNGTVFSFGGGGGAPGTVTSVGLALPSMFTVTVSPISTFGDLTAVLASQTANKVLRSGDAGGVPAFGALSAADIPTLTVSKLSDYTTATQALIDASTPTGTNNTVAYFNGSGDLTGDSGLRWDGNQFRAEHDYAGGTSLGVENDSASSAGFAQLFIQAGSIYGDSFAASVYPMDAVGGVNDAFAGQTLLRADSPNGLRIDNIAPGPLLFQVGGASQERITSAGDLELLGGNSLLFYGSTSGTLTQAVPATVTSYSVTWPAAQGAANTFPLNDGSGNLSWGSIAAGSGISVTPSGSTLTIAATGGGGNVSNTGTPLNDQIAVWTGATTVEGDAGLTYDGAAGNLTVSKSVAGARGISSQNPNTAGISELSTYVDAGGTRYLAIDTYGSAYAGVPALASTATITTGSAITEIQSSIGTLNSQTGKYTWYLGGIVGTGTLKAVLNQYGLGLGGSIPTSQFLIIGNTTQNSPTDISVNNVSTGTAGAARLTATNSVHNSYFAQLSTGYTTSNFLIADKLAIYQDSGGAGINIGTQDTAPIQFYVNNTLRAALANGGALTLTPANDTTALTITGGSVTGSGTSSALSITQTWNTSGAPTLIFANATNTASGAALLADLQVGGVSQWKVSKAGAVTSVGGYAGASATLTPANDATGLTVTGGTITGSGTTPFATFTGTWNTSGVATGILINITKTAVANTSSILDVQLGGASKFRVDQNGTIVGASTIQAGADVTAITTGAFRFGSQRMSITSPAVATLQFASQGAGDILVTWMGTTSSFPALLRNAAGLDVKLADGSAYTTIRSSNAIAPQVNPAAASGSDAAGTALTLLSGLGTGNTTPTITYVKGPASGTGSGSTVHTAVVRVAVNGTKALTDNTAASLFEVALPTLTMAGGEIVYTIEASDGTDMIAASGVIAFSGVNKGGVYTSAAALVGTEQQSKSDVTDTITNTWSVVSGTNKITLKVTPVVTGQTPTTYRITYSVISNSQQETTIL